MKEEIIMHEGRKLKVIEVIEKQEGKDKRLVEFEQWSDEAYCLEAVKKDGYALRYVKNQTEKVCLEAVKKDGDALSYVISKQTFLKIIKKIK